MIRVFGSFLASKPDEQHDAEGLTLGAWMRDNVPGYVASAIQPITAMINGRWVMPWRWARTEIRQGDVVDLRVMPAGLEQIFLGWQGREAFRAITNLLVPDIPGAPAPGQSLELAALKANTARLGSVVPDIAGSCRRYPDYLLPPRRHFTGPRTQQLETLMCIGIGDYNVPTSEIRIGDTRLDALGEEAEYQIYDANDDLAADSAAEWWQPVTEVGGTSSGSAGLDLDSTTAYTATPTVTTLDFNGDQISTTGAQVWPADWDDTLILRIERFKTYSFIDGSPRGALQGDFSDLLPINPGDRIEITGQSASGIYVVHAYNANTPGSPSTCTGSAAPSTFDFTSAAVTFQVGIGLNISSVTLDNDYVDMPGLISAINTQLIPGTVEAEDASGVVRFVEIGPPYAGNPIQLGGSYSSVLGSSPTFQTGVATSASGSLELNMPGGAPVTSLPGPWPGQLALGLVGMRYDVDSVGSNLLIVQRLTEAGDVDAGWNGFSAGQSTEFNIRVDESTAESGWTGPFAGCPEGEVTTVLEVDLFFPRGLVRLRSDGDQDATDQTVEFQWRELGSGGAWQTVSFSFVDATTDQIGFTRRINFGSAIRPEIRARRTGGGGSSKFMKTVQWYGLKARLIAPASYPWKTLTVKLKGAGKLSSQSENQINVLANRILPTVTDSGWGVPAETRSIGAFFGYIARSVGYTLQQIDIDRLYELDQFWAARGEYFDYVFDETTVRDAMGVCLKAGLASLTQEDGALVPVRDGPRTTFENGQGFSPQNMTGPLRRQFTSRSPSDADGVDVEFVNRDNNWTTETIECRLPGDLGVKAEKVKLDGVTDYTQAWRIGMRRRMEIEYRRWSYEFGTELEGLNASYLSYVPLLDDLPKYGQSSLLVDFTEDSSGEFTLQVTEPMDWSSGSHVVAWRRADGTVAGPWPAEPGPTDYHILVTPDEPPEINPGMEPPHVYFGDVDRWCFPALITAIEPQGLETSITAVNYDERVYTYDDALPD